MLEAQENSDPDALVTRAHILLHELDRGQGVLILTDMYGATPSNVARKLQGKHIASVSGINIPMLVRVLNYNSLSLEDLAEKAQSGGKEGVIYGHDKKNA